MRKSISTNVNPSTVIDFRLVAALAVAITCLGCQPQDVKPGLWLSGEAVEEPVGDWTFTDDIEEIFIQTKTWYLLPHSTTIWCAEMRGELYIGSYGENEGEKKRWEKNVARNPDARLRIDGKLYDVTITPVTGGRMVADLNIRYNEKYDMEEVFGDELPTWWFYRVMVTS